MKDRSSALDLPEWKKQQIVDAVFEAAGINQRIVNRTERENRIKVSVNGKELHYWKNKKFLRIDRVVHLIVGRTHQRLLKRSFRQTDVFQKSLEIAKETGAPVREVNEAFLSLMSRWIRTDK